MIFSVIGGTILFGLGAEIEREIFLDNIPHPLVEFVTWLNDDPQNRNDSNSHQRQLGVTNLIAEKLDTHAKSFTDTPRHATALQRITITPNEMAQAIVHDSRLVYEPDDSCVILFLYTFDICFYNLIFLQCRTCMIIYIIILYKVLK